MWLGFLFGRPKLKEHMQYCVDHPDEMNKLTKIKAQVSEVKGIMMDNIEKVSWRLELNSEFYSAVVLSMLYSGPELAYRCLWPIELVCQGYVI